MHLDTFMIITLLFMYGLSLTKYSIISGRSFLSTYA